MVGIQTTDAGWVVVLVLTYRLSFLSLVAQMVKNPPANAGDLRETGLISESGRSPAEGNSNPLQYSCLENPTDGGVWWATVHGSQRVGHD